MLLLHYGLTYRLWHRVPLLGPLEWGNFGVTVFFVVSGFLIAGHEMKQRGLAGIDLGRFYVRRFARIVPLLVAALAIVVALGLCGTASFTSDGPHPRMRLLEGAATVATFTHNLFMQAHGYTNYALDVYWSLSIEETFYVAFPIVCFLLRLDGWIACLCVALIVTAPVVRARAGNDDTVYLYGDLACFDAIGFGVLAALLASRVTPTVHQARGLRIIGAALLAITWWRGFDGDRVVFGFTLIATATALILLGCRSMSTTEDRSTIARLASPLAWMGRRSYELYLFHIVVLGSMRDAIPNSRMPGALVAPWLCLFLALSAIAAAGTARFGDRVNTRLRSAARRTGLANPTP